MVHTTKFSVAAEKLLQKANKPDTPPAIREQLIREAREMPDRNVFGAGHKKDKNGKLIEMGVGSAGNQTQQSIEAYIWTQTVFKKDGPEPGYEQNLARMKRELAECEARKAAEQKDSPEW